MRVFVTGGTGVMGRSVTAALQGAGHEVVALARSDDNAATHRARGIASVRASLFDRAGLVDAMRGCQAVANLATHMPVGTTGIRPGAWKSNDRIHVEGSRNVAEAAAEAGVTRLVQESVSFVYADHGNRLIDEDSPIAVSCAAEPVVLAETHADQFASAHRAAVVLRFGTIVGDDAVTRWRLARARAGQAVGMGRPQSWTHVVHPDDIGGAVLAALDAPSGTYNVGAEPVRRSELVAAFAEAVGQEQAGFYRRLVLRLGGDRLEWLTRSQRVSSERFHRATGWTPAHPRFDAGWLAPMVMEAASA
ncbi:MULTISPECIES: NAD(P)-dependent oxidoreductase [unclassified Mumia]|uniref:NAD-dependent epimerase/dehydratase family protein n=1 Tax=unclassified Mumia TaxID=2621872 RepID=UPI0026157B91|nr:MULTISPECIES: NAD(P)-dependent oxidoreductase [unclassified Mumia]MDD9349207.1 NAD(P)-dependent oxidoreductase [Mumia sp.]